jgi:NADH:ubiquinone oxidoreductase subunit 3 (subunit A)
MQTPNHKLEVVISTILAVLTFSIFSVSIYFASEWLIHISELSLIAVVTNGIFVLIITAFAYGNLLYQITRVGYYLRLDGITNFGICLAPGLP